MPSELKDVKNSETGMTPATLYSPKVVYKSLPRVNAHVGPLFNIESYDGSFGHMWRVNL